MTEVNEMNSNDLMSAINSAETPEVEKEEKVVIEAKPEKEPEVEVEQEDENDAQSDDVPFPKKAVNAISYHKKKLFKMESTLETVKAENARITAERDSLQKHIESLKAPNPADYTDTDKYLTDKADYQIEKKHADRELAALDKQEEQVTSVAQSAQEEQDNEYFLEKQALVTKAESEIPDFRETINAVAPIFDFIDNNPDRYAHIEKHLMSLDNPEMAIYNLAKDGKLESLLKMSSEMAALTLYNAQSRKAVSEKDAEQEVPVIAKTQAPRPLTKVNGVGVTKTTVEGLSSTDLLKAIRK